MPEATAVTAEKPTAPETEVSKPGTQLDRANFSSQRDYEEAMLDSMFADPSETEQTEQAQDQPAPPKQDAEESTDEPEAEKPEEKSQEEQPSEEEPAQEPEWTPPAKLADLADQLEIPHETILGMKVDTSEGEITVAEAIRGHLRDADYRHKTMDLSEKRKAHDAAVEQAQTHWSQRFQELNEVAVALSQLAPGISEAEIRDYANPNSQNFNPEKAFLLRENQLQWNTAFEQVKAASRKQMEAHQAQLQQQENERRAEQDRQLLQALPELSDMKTRDVFGTKIVEGLTSNYGFAKDEVIQWMKSAYDYRFFPVLKDALEMQALRKGKKETAKTVKSIPKIVKAGAPKKADPNQRKSTALDRLKRARTPQEAKKAEMGFLDSIFGD